MNQTNEQWQLMVDEEVFETDLATIKQWIAQGRIQPTDKIKKGNLNWKEAAKVPALKDLFPGAISTTNATATINKNNSFIAQWQQIINRNACQNHAEIKPDFFCSTCNIAVCANCTNTIAHGSGSICTTCGELCQPFNQWQEKVLNIVDQKTAFGFEDLIFAFKYANKEAISIGLYGLLFGASLFGSVYIIIGPMISSALLFPFMAYVIKVISSGTKETGLATFDLGDANNNYYQGLIVGAMIFLICLSPYGFYQLAISMKDRDAVLAFTNFQAVFAPKLTLISLLLLLWAIIYFPIGILIGAITESPLAIINPLLALSVFRTGIDYLKAFLMYLCATAMAGLSILFFMQIVLGGVNKIVTIDTIRLLLLFTFMGVPIFYCNMVIACILGRLLFKNKEQMGMSEID